MIDLKKQSADAPATAHEAVLLQEVISGLSIKPDDAVFDGTEGGGGHSEAIALLLNERGTIIGCDLDATALKRVEERLKLTRPSLHLVKANFRDLPKILFALDVPSVTKVLFDLGLSSDELEHSGRGFSFRNESEPLLMTYDDEPRDGDLTARWIVNEWGEESLVDIINGYGEERRAKTIAKAIVEAREEKPIETVGDLNTVIASTGGSRTRIHPSTRTFQALRMAVNDETGSLQEGIAGALEKLSRGGRLAIITFESITDRIVKNAFKDAAAEEKGTIVTKKPIVASPEEIEHNPRSRSAKLRIFQKA